MFNCNATLFLVKPDEVLEAIYSLDTHQAWLGAWEIVRTHNKKLDIEFLPHLTKISDAVHNLRPSETPSLRDSRDIVWTALHIIEGRSKNLCRCNIYPHTNQLHPKDQAKHALVKLISEDEPKDWMCKFTCQCKACDQLFSVIENHGYHYPISKWSLI